MAETHELTWDEDHPEDDRYRCTCGLTFQANGDIQEAFEHGLEVGRKEVADGQR